MKAPTIETTDEFTGDIRIVVVELDVVVAAVAAAAAGLISCPPGVAAHAVQPLRLLGGGSQHPDRASTELLVRVRPRVAVQPPRLLRVRPEERYPNLLHRSVRGRGRNGGGESRQQEEDGDGRGDGRQAVEPSHLYRELQRAE